MRYRIIDGFRGFFLLFMGVVHLNAVLDTTLGKLNHHYLGWVEDAQGFVFISGAVVGMVYGGTLIRRGPREMARRIRARIARIWSHHAALVLGALLLTGLLGGLGLAPGFLSGYRADPLGFTLASLGLVSASLHLGILPMYVLMMLATPAILRALHRGQAPAVLMASFLVWLILGQTHVMSSLAAWAGEIAAAHGRDIAFGTYFNVFGWQLLYVTGLTGGYLAKAGRLELGFLRGKAWRGAFFVALAGALAFAALDRIVFAEEVLPEFSALVLASVSRQDLSALYVLAFFLDLFLVVWLLVAGRESGSRWIAGLARLLERAMTLRPLVFLGQHALHVFSWHIVLVYLVSVLAEGRQVGEAAGSVVLLAGVGTLFLAARVHAFLQARELPAPAPALAPALVRVNPVP